MVTFPSTTTSSHGKSSFGLDELGHIQPGLARIMPEIGARIWKCYYAGKAAISHWRASSSRRPSTSWRWAALVRPKYEENMTKFIAEDVEQVKKAIEAKDWDKFDTAFHAMVDQADAYHELYDKEFLRWKIPDQPPPDLDMTPRR